MLEADKCEMLEEKNKCKRHIMNQNDFSSLSIIVLLFFVTNDTKNFTIFSITTEFVNQDFSIWTVHLSYKS